MHSHPSSASMAAVHSCFNSCSHKHKIIHLTIISSSQSSSSCSTNLSNKSNVSLHSLKSSSSLTEKPLRNGKTRVSLMVTKPCSVKKKPVWKNLVFGSKRLRSIILLHIICIVYASNIAVIKDVEAFTDPAYFSAVRFVVSTIPFLPFILKARDDAEVRSSGLELGLWVSLGYLGEALGLVSADAGRASFISLFTVIVIPLLESLLGETVPARTWFGILMSVVGISMLECSGSPPNIGDLFNFLSAIFFGIHTLRTEQISKTTRKENFLALLGYEILGASSNETIEVSNGVKENGSLMGSNKNTMKKTMSASPVMVSTSSRNNVIHILKK